MENNIFALKGNIIAKSGQGENPNAEDLLLRQAMGLTTEKK